jgi:hypothetical protein
MNAVMQPLVNNGPIAGDETAVPPLSPHRNPTYLLEPQQGVFDLGIPCGCMARMSWRSGCWRSPPGAIGAFELSEYLGLAVIWGPLPSPLHSVLWNGYFERQVTLYTGPD